MLNVFNMFYYHNQLFTFVKAINKCDDVKNENFIYQLIVFIKQTLERNPKVTYKTFCLLLSFSFRIYHNKMVMDFGNQIT